MFIRKKFVKRSICKNLFFQKLRETTNLSLEVDKMAINDNSIIPKISEINVNLPNLIDENAGRANLSIGEYLTVGSIITGLAIFAGFAMYYFRSEIGEMYESGINGFTGLFPWNSSI